MTATSERGSSQPIIERLKRRGDFVTLAGASKWVTPGVVMQARRREEAGPARLGFTVTKRIGTAVVRNRVRRRLREAARMAFAGRVRAGYDYVLVGRATTVRRRYNDLVSDLEAALENIHAGRSHAGRRARGNHAGETKTASKTKGQN